MRVFIFFISVFALMGSGIWLLTQDGNSSNIEIPYLSEHLETVTGQKVASQEKWKDILVGKWNLYIKFNYPVAVEVFSGEVEYKSDGSFTKYLTFNRFNSGYDFSKDDACIISGGSLLGEWAINESETWSETYTKCNLENSYKSGYIVRKGTDICKDYFREEILYGNFNTEVIKSKIIEFNESKIHVKVKSFSSGETDDFILTRN